MTPAAPSPRWRVTSLLARSGRVVAVHVTPVLDLVSHVHSAACWCEPHLEDDPDFIAPLFRHNAADERECYEDGQARPSVLWV